MIIVIIRRAQRDLAGISEFVAASNPTAAERVVARLLDVIRQIADGQLQGREIRLVDGRRVRRWSVPPYAVYYRRSAQRTEIVRVYHQARRPLED